MKRRQLLKEINKLEREETAEKRERARRAEELRKQKEEAQKKQLQAQHEEFVRQQKMAEDNINMIQQLAREYEQLAEKQEQYQKRLNKVLRPPEENTEDLMTEEELRTEYAIEKTKQTLQYKIAAIKQEKIAEEEKTEKIKALLEEERKAKMAAVGDTLGIMVDVFKKESLAYKVTASARALIDTYAAATKALTLGFPLGWIQAAAVTAAGLANVAKINSVKFQAGGIISGPSHAEGGVPVKMSGGGYVEAEGGELIVNKNIWRRPDYVRAISEMNARTGGVRFYAAGGVLPPLGQVPDINEAIEKAIAGITAIPVVVSERDITAMQRKVQVIDNITRI